MKKLGIVTIIAVVFAAVLGLSAQSAVAFPTKTSACSNCHGTSTAVKITVTKVSSTSKSIKYKVKVTGGSGTAGWAAFVGGKNIAHKTASTGYFSVAPGKSVKVWAVKFGSGANSKKFTAKR